MRILGRFLLRAAGSPVDGEEGHMQMLETSRTLKDYRFGYLLRVFFGWATFPLLSKA